MADNDKVKDQHPEATSGQPDQDVQKVELDLDDAPFLQWEEEEDAEPDHGAGAQAGTSDGVGQEAQGSLWAGWKDRRLVRLAAGLIMASLLLGLAWFVLWKKDLSPPDLSPEKPEQKKAAETGPKSEKILFEPFWVEYETESGFRFLHFEFALQSGNTKLSWEIDRKRIVIRDAIYYYLKNKKLLFLLNKGNVPSLKNDLISVINQYLSSGKIQTILIQDFVVD